MVATWEQVCLFTCVLEAPSSPLPWKRGARLESSHSATGPKLSGLPARPEPGVARPRQSPTSLPSQLTHLHLNKHRSDFLLGWEPERFNLGAEVAQKSPWVAVGVW